MWNRIWNETEMIGFHSDGSNWNTKPSLFLRIRSAASDRGLQNPKHSWCFAKKLFYSFLKLLLQTAIIFLGVSNRKCSFTVLEFGSSKSRCPGLLVASFWSHPHPGSLCLFVFLVCSFSVWSVWRNWRLWAFHTGRWGPLTVFSVFTPRVRSFYTCFSLASAQRFPLSFSLSPCPSSSPPSSLLSHMRENIYYWA